MQSSQKVVGRGEYYNETYYCHTESPRDKPYRNRGKEEDEGDKDAIDVNEIFEELVPQSRAPNTQVPLNPAAQGFTMTETTPSTAPPTENAAPGTTLMLEVDDIHAGTRIDRRDRIYRKSKI